MTEPRSTRHFRPVAAGLLAALAALPLAAPTQAADTEQAIHFAAGSSSASLTGTVKGYDTATYTLDARKGQTMTVVLASAGSVACIFNVQPPTGDPLFMGSAGGNAFTGTLPVDGRYAVGVFQMRAAILEHETCRFTLSVSIQ